MEANRHQRDASFVFPVVDQEESQALGWSQEELISFQRSDETLGVVAAWLENQARPNWKETFSQDPELRAYWLQWDSLELQAGLIYRRFETPDGLCKHMQMAMPRKIRARFLEFLHCKVGGHLGMRDS